MKPSDITVSTAHLYDGYTAPEGRAIRAVDAWEVRAEVKGLPLRAFQRASGVHEGHVVVAWCVDEREDMYLVVFDESAHMVSAVYYGKAKRKTEEKEI